MGSENALILVLLLALLVIGAFPGFLFAQAFFFKRRWGVVEGPMKERQDASYRGEAFVRTEIARNAPAGTHWGSTFAAMWASFTVFVLVPVGALVGITVMREQAVVLGVALLATALSGLVLSIGVLRACARIARRHPRSIDGTLLMVRFGYFHHAAVWVAAMASFVVLDRERWLLWTLLIGVPCGLGLLAALALRHAVDEAVAFRRTEIFPAPPAPDEVGAEQTPR